MKLRSFYRDLLQNLSSEISVLLGKSSASALTEDDLNSFFNHLADLHETFDLVSFCNMLKR